MNQLTKSSLVVVIAATLWLPYYVWGVGSGNRFLAQGKYLSSALIVSLTVLLGFFGLHFLQRYMVSQSAVSTANFRLLLILSTQLSAVILIAIDSNFNWKAILAGVFVLAGAGIGAYAIE